MHDAGLAPEGERLLEQLFVKARVRLRRVVAGAWVVQNERVESRGC